MTESTTPPPGGPPPAGPPPALPGYPPPQWPATTEGRAGEPPAYTPPPGGYGSAPGTGQPPPGYGQAPAYGPPPSYGQPPPPGYGQPPPGYGPPPGYAAPPAGYPVPAGYGGALGRRRSIGVSILLAIVTIGIYTLVWVYRTQKEMKQYTGRGLGGGLGLLLYILVSPVTYFIVPSEVAFLYEGVDRRQSPVSVLTGFWVLLPIAGAIVWFVKVQGALNAYWEAHGAPPP